MKELRMWCYKVLPLVYDDSLSYYEMVCKLKAKVNEMIGVIDDIPEAVKAYLDTDDFKAYIALLVDSMKSGFVSVDDYGAKGDGETNDWQAFHDAAEASGELGLPLIADGEKTYAIGGSRIKLYESVNFNGCTLKGLNTNYEYLFRIEPPQSQQTSVLADDLAYNRTTVERLWGKVLNITSPLSLGHRYGDESEAIMYHCQTIVTDNSGYFINVPYYPEIVSGEYNIDYCDATLKPIVFENVRLVNSNNTATALLNIDRPNVDVKHIRFVGDSSVATSLHNPVIGCWGLSYNVNFYDIIGNVPWHRPNTGYVVGIYGGSDNIVEGLRGLNLNGSIAWPSLGCSRPCNLTLRNCNMWRFDSHYECMGYFHAHDCTVNAIGLSGGWGEVIIENCNILQNGPENPQFWCGFRNDTALPYSGTCMFKNLSLSGCKSLAKFNFQREAINNVNFNETNIIFDNIQFLTAMPDHSTFLEVNDARGYVHNITIRNTYFDCQGGLIKGSAGTYNIIIENSYFYKYTSFEAKCDNLYVRNSYISSIYFNENLATPNVYIQNCKLNNITGINEGNLRPRNGMLVITGCVIYEMTGAPSSQYITNYCFDNNICLGSSHEYQNELNGVIV